MTMTDLPTYLPLSQVAEQYQLSREALRQAVNDGTIKAARVPGGEIFVDTDDVKRLTLPVDPELEGQPIRVTEAAEKYGVEQSSLTRWANAGYIQILEKGPKLLILDEGHVQRAVTIFHHACRETGSYVRAGWVLKRIFAQAQTN